MFKLIVIAAVCAVAAAAPGLIGSPLSLGLNAPIITSGIGAGIATPLTAGIGVPLGVDVASPLGLAPSLRWAAPEIGLAAPGLDWAATGLGLGLDLAAPSLGLAAPLGLDAPIINDGLPISAAAGVLRSPLISSPLLIKKA